jgi:RND family efflux transporter MFP subunit
MADPTKPAGTRFFLVLGLIVLALVVAGAFTLVARRTDSRALAEETAAASVPTVSVIHPSGEGPSEEMVLPSTLEAAVEAPIYARTSGYLHSWAHDIGAHVERGDLLAEIDTPEVDQELAQARATRQQISANMELAKSTAARWEELRKADAVSQQELDEKKSAYTQLQANLAASDANVQRLEQLESFKHVYAPFAGVITKRNVDVGTLINAGNGGAQQQLFHLSQTDPIKVFVQVPEASAPAIHKGLPASIELTQFPGQSFAGEVVRTSGSIDPTTRTLLTEVDVPNRDGRLLPGGYAQVHLKVAGSGARLRVPINTLLFRAEGVRAAVVDDSGHAHLRPVEIGRDYGTTVEVVSGLTANDWIILNPADALEDGQAVHAQKTTAPADKPEKSGGTK